MPKDRSSRLRRGPGSGRGRGRAGRCRGTRWGARRRRRGRAAAARARIGDRDQILDLGRVGHGNRRPGGGRRVELRVRHVEGPECDRQSEDRPVGGHGGERGVLVRDELGGGFDLLDARLSLLIASMASGVPSRMGSAGIADFTSTSSTTSDNTTILDCPGFLGGVTYGKLGSTPPSCGNARWPRFELRAESGTRAGRLPPGTALGVVIVPKHGFYCVGGLSESLARPFELARWTGLPCACMMRWAASSAPLNSARPLHMRSMMNCLASGGNSPKDFSSS